MDQENPYHTPQQPVDPPKPSLLPWTVVTVLGTSFLCGVIGTCLGAALGWLSPGYYRSVFANGNSPSFDPVAVGIGQGLTQGVVFGAVVGLALVALFYWARSRQ